MSKSKEYDVHDFTDPSTEYQIPDFRGMSDDYLKLYIVDCIDLLSEVESHSNLFPFMLQLACGELDRRMGCFGGDTEVVLDTSKPDFSALSDDDLARKIEFLSAATAHFARRDEHEKATEMSALVEAGVAEQERRVAMGRVH
jgi:hypothetical protein